MPNQTTDTLLMVRPNAFRMNEQTAVNNFYQKSTPFTAELSIKEKAIAEFDQLVKRLKELGVKVLIFEGRQEIDTPDAVFPNNWVSFHQSGIVVCYPMFAKNRRAERRKDVFDILKQRGYTIDQKIDFTGKESEGKFLEGTGSMVLDRVHKKAYCALSPRANLDLLHEFCERLEYTPVPFVANQAVGQSRKPIYHTNVMMSIGEHFAVVCLESLDDKNQRKQLIQNLMADNKEIIPITEAQVSRFAGNILQIKNSDGKRIIAMSESAFKCLDERQRETLSRHGGILRSPIPTIETYGGGSVRCTMAEVFLPKT